MLNKRRFYSITIIMFLIFIVVLFYFFTKGKLGVGQEVTRDYSIKDGARQSEVNVSDARSGVGFDKTEDGKKGQLLKPASDSRRVHFVESSSNRCGEAGGVALEMEGAEQGVRSFDLDCRIESINRVLEVGDYKVGLGNLRRSMGEVIVLYNVIDGSSPRFILASEVTLSPGDDHVAYVEYLTRQRLREGEKPKLRALNQHGNTMDSVTLYPNNSNYKRKRESSFVSPFLWSGDGEKVCFYSKLSSPDKPWEAYELRWVKIDISQGVENPLYTIENIDPKKFVKSEHNLEDIRFFIQSVSEQQEGVYEATLYPYWYWLSDTITLRCE